MLGRILIALALIAGCAPAYAPPPLRPSHPASLETAEAPAPEPSTALVSDVAPPAAPEGNESHEKHGSAHGGHR